MKVSNNLQNCNAKILPTQCPHVQQNLIENVYEKIINMI